MSADAHPSTSLTQDEIKAMRKRFLAVRRVVKTIDHAEECPGEENERDCDCPRRDLLRIVDACSAAPPQQEAEALRLFMTQLRLDLDSWCHAEDCEADSGEECTCAFGPLLNAIDPPEDRTP